MNKSRKLLPDEFELQLVVSCHCCLSDLNQGRCGSAKPPNHLELLMVNRIQSLDIL